MYTITQEELMLTNKIFIEHDKFSKQIPLLENKIQNLEYLNTQWIAQDSINKRNFDIILQENETLEIKIKKKDKILLGSIIIATLSFIICLVK